MTQAKDCLNTPQSPPNTTVEAAASSCNAATDATMDMDSFTILKNPAGEFSYEDLRRNLQKVEAEMNDMLEEQDDEDENVRDSEKFLELKGEHAQYLKLLEGTQEWWEEKDFRERRCCREDGASVSDTICDPIYFRRLTKKYERCDQSMRQLVQQHGTAIRETDEYQRLYKKKQIYLSRLEQTDEWQEQQAVSSVDLDFDFTEGEEDYPDDDSYSQSDNASRNRRKQTLDLVRSLNRAELRQQRIHRNFNENGPGITGSSCKMSPSQKDPLVDNGKYHSHMVAQARNVYDDDHSDAHTTASMSSTSTDDDDTVSRHDSLFLSPGASRRDSSFLSQGVGDISSSSLLTTRWERVAQDPACRLPRIGGDDENDDNDNQDSTEKENGGDLSARKKSKPSMDASPSRPFVNSSTLPPQLPKRSWNNSPIQSPQQQSRPVAVAPQLVPSKSSKARLVPSKARMMSCNEGSQRWDASSLHSRDGSAQSRDRSTKSRKSKESSWSSFNSDDLPQRNNNDYSRRTNKFHESIHSTSSSKGSMYRTYIPGNDDEETVVAVSIAMEVLAVRKKRRKDEILKQRLELMRKIQEKIHWDQKMIENEQMDHAAKNEQPRTLLQSFSDVGHETRDRNEANSCRQKPRETNGGGSIPSVVSISSF